MGLFENLSERPPDWELNPDADLAQGLVFFGGGRYHGTAYYDDASGYGNHGTLTNMDPATDWLWEPTLGRWALDFDGSNDSVALRTGLPGAVTAFTVSCWIVKQSVAASVFLLSAGNAAFDYDWGFYQSAPTEVLGFFLKITDGTSKVASESSASSLFAAHHLAGWYDGANVHFAVDGKEFTPVANAGVLRDSGYTTRIGSWGTSRYWIGKIGDVMMWDRILTSSEISALADPSNVMLSGLLLPPRRSMWPSVVAGAPATTIRWPWQKRYHRRMTGAY